MAHFYGTVRGNGGQASRLGTKASGLVTEAYVSEGRIRVVLGYNPKTGLDNYVICLISKDQTLNLARGNFL